MKYVLPVVLLATLISLGIWLTRQLAIDSCLDRGGRWNYSEAACEGAEE